MVNIATCLAMVLLSASLNSGYGMENNDAGVPLRKNTDTYYLDSEKGDDSNDGKSRKSAHR